MKLSLLPRRFPFSPACRVLLSALLIGGGAPRVLADTIAWVGSDTNGNANFSDADNWSAPTVPGAGDTVEIEGSGFSTSLNIRNTDGTDPGTWTVGNWDYNTSTTLSVLGRGPVGSTVGLSITGTLTKLGKSLAFRDSANNRFLSLTINDIEMEAGTLSLGSSSNALTAFSASTANISGGILSLRSISSGTFNISNINFVGSGTLDLHGTGSGESSTLTTTSLTSTGAVGTITTTDGNTGTLSITSAVGSTATYGGLIAGAGTSLQKKGAGTQVLTGANTYGGGTTVSAGTLLISNGAGSSGSGTGNVVVQTGGVLGGTGFIGGAVSTQSVGSTSLQNGHLAPGNNGAGVLTIQNTLSLADHTFLDFELNTPNVAGGTGGNDLLSVLGTSGSNGDVTLGSDIVLNLTGEGANFGVGTYDLIDFTGTLTGAGNLASWTVEGFTGTYSFGSDGDSVFLTITSVPEPGTTALIIMGAAGLVGFVRRHRKI